MKRKELDSSVEIEQKLKRISLKERQETTKDSLLTLTELTAVINDVAMGGMNTDEPGDAGGTGSSHRQALPDSSHPSIQTDRPSSPLKNSRSRHGKGLHLKIGFKNMSSLQVIQETELEGTLDELASARPISPLPRSKRYTRKPPPRLNLLPIYSTSKKPGQEGFAFTFESPLTGQSANFDLPSSMLSSATTVTPSSATPSYRMPWSSYKLNPEHSQVVIYSPIPPLSATEEPMNCPASQEPRVRASSQSSSFAGPLPLAYTSVDASLDHHMSSLAAANSPPLAPPNSLENAAPPDLELVLPLDFEARILESSSQMQDLMNDISPGRLHPDDSYEYLIDDQMN
ncbi:hypothetical protein HDV03_002055 [Kappamyces sp. JEL0829]|nr:hypothetical protein HDV03_002055 [Kappamyces sp. JEL0829]